MKIVFASRERLLFLPKLEELILRLLRHPEAFVSDETRLSDFYSDDTDGPDPFPFRKMFVRKVLRHTGVDIEPVFNEYLPKILHYIAEHMPEEKRKKFYVKYTLQ